MPNSPLRPLLTGRADRRDWQVALDRLLPRDLWYLIVCIILLLLAHKYWADEPVIILTAVFGAVAVMRAIHAWFIRWITEIAITDKRVIYKRGFINRRTVETNMDKVVTVDVDQSVLGHLLNYGTVTVKGNRSDLRATTARRIAD